MAGARTIVVGTRRSALALTQTGQVIEDLARIARELGLAYRFETRHIVTKGDRILDVSLSKVGGKGLFVKEIEQELLSGGIDIAVHSMKDVPHTLEDGLAIGAVPRRVDPRDALIARGARSIAELPRGARVGTSSLRRMCQLKAIRPDLRLEPLRGNIDTRLKKLETEGFDAIILAMAGLKRMGWEDRASAPIPVEACVPAAGQGALGVECRADDEELLALLGRYNDEATARAVEAERSFLAELNGGCQVPIGAYAETAGAMIRLTGMIGTPDGETLLKESMEGTDPRLLGRELARRLLRLGADRILADVR
ncbi:MAG: hydroxymethylbilane synthase [Thermobacillus sp. ZCTH02-B1]|uniref:hydroxymethylbilane synthase n=1 Tax=Thermobacillus sp. ZCTH02-B1 TaxID=1858795 RepID=UPI000B558611|nr:hydroxymethylbilane synthase [Thermobacillus sp. ZCTH02-B1]OUM96105.1 MAG: hydroxymethylbilane synthase [Thermobacillus sp. ZCTH02-B1]